jgi:hypothetical protein
LLASLTWKLILSPGHAWPRMSAAVHGESALADPALQAGAVGGVSAACVLVAAALRPGATTSGAIVTTLIAIAGYVGAAALSVSFAPRFVDAPEHRTALIPRFTSAASLPVIASGAAHLVPHSIVSVMATVLGAVITYCSGSLGARDFLGIEGTNRTRAATMTTLVSTPPALCTALLLALR